MLHVGCQHLGKSLILTSQLRHKKCRQSILAQSSLSHPLEPDKFISRECYSEYTEFRGHDASLHVFFTFRHLINAEKARNHRFCDLESYCIPSGFQKKNHGPSLERAYAVSMIKSVLFIRNNTNYPFCRAAINSKPVWPASTQQIYNLGQSKTIKAGAKTDSALESSVRLANQQKLNLLMIAELLPQKLFMDFQYFLFIIIEEHSKRRAMSDYNLHQMRDLDSYGDHLFCLDQKYLSFWTEEPQEIENHLQTKISCGGPEAAQEKGKNKKAEVVWTDEHFEMGFMKEHKFILKKYIRNYMGLFQAQNEATPDRQNTHQSAKEVYPLQKALQAIKEHDINCPQGQKCSIDEQLLTNPKIVAFLNMVLEEFQPLVSLTLLKLFKILWGEYMNKEDKKIGEREIIEFTNRLMTSTFLKRTLLVLPNKGKEIALTTMKEFLNVMANTLFFVGCEFFLNPYYQLQEELIVKEFHNYELFMYDSCIIDQQAQEEDQCEGKKGRKLVKLDHSHGG